MFGTTARATLIVSAKDEASDVMGSLAKRAQEAEKGVSGLGEAANKAAGSSSSGIGSMIGQVAGAAGLTIGLVGLIGAARSAGSQAIQLGMQAEQTAVAFKTLLGSTEAATAHLKDLRDFAAKTPFQFNDLVESSKRLQALGFEAKQVVPMLRDIGDAVAAMGGNNQMIDRVVMALGQMQAKGRASGEELLQLTEAGIPALKYMASQAGVSTAEMQKLISKGLIPADQAIQAILAGMREDFGGMMAKQAETATGKVSNLEDAWVSLLTAFGEKTTQSLGKGSDALATFLANYAKVTFSNLNDAATRADLGSTMKWLYLQSAILQATGDTVGATNAAAEATRLLDISLEPVRNKIGAMEKLAWEKRWVGYAEEWKQKLGEVAQQADELTKRLDPQNLAQVNLSSFVQGNVGKEIKSYTESMDELKAKQAELRGEIDKLTASNGQYYKTVTSNGMTDNERTLTTLQLAEAQRKLGEEMGKTGDSYDPMKVAQLNVQIERLQGEISGATTVTSGYINNNKKIGETTKEYDDVTAAIKAQEEEHSRATKMILFNIIQQQMANLGLLDTGGGALVELARRWGLIDNATAEATGQILNGLRESSAQGNWQPLYDAADTAKNKILGIPTYTKSTIEVETKYTTSGVPSTQATQFGSENFGGAGGGSGGSSGGGGGSGGYGDSYDGAQAFGGPVSAGGSYLWQESVYTRPEVFVPGTSGAVLTRQQVASAFGSGGGDMAEVAAAMRAMPGMLARAIRAEKAFAVTRG